MRVRMVLDHYDESVEIVQTIPDGSQYYAIMYQAYKLCRGAGFNPFEGDKIRDIIEYGVEYDSDEIKA